MIKNEIHPAREVLCFSSDPVPQDPLGTLLRMQAELLVRQADDSRPYGHSDRVGQQCQCLLSPLLALGPPLPGGFCLDRLCFSSKRTGGFCICHTGNPRRSVG